ncbi:DUF5129 domain-containing protein [Actinomyces bouchesdurhonensis]|uniref:DUF5129 domain-containing protein n=1 Tax=Actinomyces bouchesdurhonensis TaxID=1852361 RepID=UPI0023F471D3|nr:DUF5129 domain-containing protein [Actinomyces bouchesdurhonensis]
MTSVTNAPMNNAATPGELSPSARGCLRLGAGLALFLVAPAWLGIASLVGAWHSIQWPAWYAWVASIVGVVVLVRGAMLRRRLRESMREAIRGWDDLERCHASVELAVATLLTSGRYERGVNARYQAARAQRERARAVIASCGALSFPASLSAATSRSVERAVASFPSLMDADASMMAACEFFDRGHNWRRVWNNEVGVVFEDMTVIETITDSIQWRSRAPMVRTMVASLVEWLDEQRLAVIDISESLDRAAITPAQALDHLDAIADEARVRLVELIEAALASDTSMLGRRRYKRWRNGAGEKLRTNETRYIGAYRIAGVTYSYNPAQAVRLTANSAGIDLAGSAAHSTARFVAFNAGLRASRVPSPLPRVGWDVAVRILARDVPDVGGEHWSAQERDRFVTEAGASSSNRRARGTMVRLRALRISRVQVSSIVEGDEEL